MEPYRARRWRAVQRDGLVHRGSWRRSPSRRMPTAKRRRRRAGRGTDGVCNGTSPGAGMGFARGQATVQGTPLSVKAVGLAVLPVWVAWKPMFTVAPGAIVALWLT